MELVLFVNLDISNDRLVRMFFEGDYNLLFREKAYSSYTL